MVKFSQQPTSCLSAFNHFVELALKGLTNKILKILNFSIMSVSALRNLRKAPERYWKDYFISHGFHAQLPAWVDEIMSVVVEN